MGGIYFPAPYDAGTKDKSAIEAQMRQLFDAMTPQLYESVIKEVGAAESEVSGIMKIVSSSSMRLSFDDAVKFTEAIHRAGQLRELLRLFKEAITYFNENVFDQRLTEQHVIDLYEYSRGDLLNPDYTTQIRDQRLKTFIRIEGAAGLVARANRKVHSLKEVIDGATRIFSLIAIQQMFVDKNSGNALPGFDSIIPQYRRFSLMTKHDTDQPAETADGHHRLGWFVMNYFIMRNGYQPFYFRGIDEYVRMKLGFAFDIRKREIFFKGLLENAYAAIINKQRDLLQEKDIINAGRNISRILKPNGWRVRELTTHTLEALGIIEFTAEQFVRVLEVLVSEGLLRIRSNGWEPGELRFLTENWRKMTNKGLAQALGRTESGVRSWLSTLGLIRETAYGREVMDFINRYYVQERFTGIRVVAELKNAGLVSDSFTVKTLDKLVQNGRVNHKRGPYKRVRSSSSLENSAGLLQKTEVAYNAIVEDKSGILRFADLPFYMRKIYALAMELSNKRVFDQQVRAHVKTSERIFKDSVEVRGTLLNDIADSVDREVSGYLNERYGLEIPSFSGHVLFNDSYIPVSDDDGSLVVSGWGISVVLPLHNRVVISVNSPTLYKLFLPEYSKYEDIVGMKMQFSAQGFPSQILQEGFLELLTQDFYAFKGFPQILTASRERFIVRRIINELRIWASQEEIVQWFFTGTTESMLSVIFDDELWKSLFKIENTPADDHTMYRAAENVIVRKIESTLHAASSAITYRKKTFVLPPFGEFYYGALKDFQDLPSVQRVVNIANNVLAYDISGMLFDEQQETIYGNRESMAAIVASIAYFNAVEDLTEITPFEDDVLLGISAGELTALYIGGALSLEDTLRYAKELADAFDSQKPERAYDVGILRMTRPESVMELEQRGFLKVMIDIGSGLYTVVVNKQSDNSPVSLIKQGNGRFIPLNGFHWPMHTSWAEYVSRSMANAIDRLRIHTPQLGVISNSKAEIMRSAWSIRQDLSDTIVKPVRFIESFEKARQVGNDLFVLVGPLKHGSLGLRRADMEYIRLSSRKEMEDFRIEQSSSSSVITQFIPKTAIRIFCRSRSVMSYAVKEV